MSRYIPTFINDFQHHSFSKLALTCRQEGREGGRKEQM